MASQSENKQKLVGQIKRSINKTNPKEDKQTIIQ